MVVVAVVVVGMVVMRSGVEAVVRGVKVAVWWCWWWRVVVVVVVAAVRGGQGDVDPFSTPPYPPCGLRVGR